MSMFQRAPAPATMSPGIVRSSTPTYGEPASAPAPFVWGQGNEAVTPQALARQRKVADAFRMAPGYVPPGWASLAGGLADEAVAAFRDKRTDATEAAKQQAVAEALKAAQGGSDPNAYLNVVGDPFASPQQSAVAQAMYQQAQNAPDKELERQYKEAQIAQLTAKTGGFRPMTAEEKTAYGLPADSAAQIGPDGKVDTLGSTSAGMSMTLPDGTVVQMGGKPLTEAQGKDTYFVNQGAPQIEVLDKLGDTLTSLTQGGALGGTPLVGNFLKSDEYQQAETAGRIFLNSILRKESGAAITEEEDRRYGNTYLPRPGDKPGQLELKRKARANALAGIAIGLPATAILALTNAGVDIGALAAEGHGTAPAAPAAPAVTAPPPVTDAPPPGFSPTPHPGVFIKPLTPPDATAVPSGAVQIGT